MAKRKVPEGIVLFASLEAEDFVEVEVTVSAPNRATARRVLGEITRAVTGEDAEEKNGPRLVFADGLEVPTPPDSNPEDSED